jgi:hypothetical protein
MACTGIQAMSRNVTVSVKLDAQVPATAMYTSEQMLEKALENCHFMPLFDPLYTIRTRRNSIRKWFRANLIRRRKRRIWVIWRPHGIGAPKTATPIDA